MNREPSFRRARRAAAWIGNVLPPLVFGDQASSRAARLECARLAATLFGDFPLSDDYKLWREDTAFLADHARLSPGYPYTADRHFTLREFARSVRSVPGRVAECGCYRGASAYFLAQALPEVPLHLFDSFEGLSALHARDRLPNGRSPWRAGGLRAPEEAVRDTLRRFSNVSIHRGWIPSRFAEVADHRFRLVHIDVDLYEPTLDSLRFFLPRMVRGGVIVLDDYGFTSCPGVYRATHEALDGRPEVVVHLATGQGIIFSPGF